MTNQDLEQQILQMAHHIIENKSTIRATANAFCKPKSTVHHDLSTKLKYINLSLYNDVKKLLKHNFQNKHLHGGESTKNKYLKLKNCINKNDELDFIK